MIQKIEDFFKFSELNTNFRTEVIAGITTFMTMAYIIFVNPAIISKTGIDFGAAVSATCIATALTTIMMGFYANYPIALAPGMGINAFFTYTVCLKMGITWQVALGCVFIEGVIFIILTLTRVRQALFETIPVCVRYGTACGIGLFISFIGLKDAGIVTAHPVTFVTLGDMHCPASLLALFGLLLTCVLIVKNVKGAILWGMFITALIGVPAGLLKYNGVISMPPSITPTFMQMDIMGALDMGLLSIIFIFLFVDVFDTMGTLSGVGELGGFIKGGKMPRVERAMMTDAVGTCIGAASGTPTVTSYIESASGISAGGRTGLTSIVTGALFLAALFFSPLVKMIGGGWTGNSGEPLYPVTAPALIIVGSMMLKSVVNINWREYTELIPAFLTIILIPLTFSIATGIAMGFISYAALKLFSGRGKEVPWLVYILAGLFVARFVYLRG